MKSSQSRYKKRKTIFQAVTVGKMQLLLSNRLPWSTWHHEASNSTEASNKMVCTF